MRVVLGLSLTSTSAAWVLVDTHDGRIVADELVALDSVDEVARAAALSVQSFALQSDEDIDGVRLVWDDSDGAARQHGIRLRTKLRLFGFEQVETVTEDAAREGRNRTARHIAPHLALAYGAARADAADTDGEGVLHRLAALIPGRHPDDLDDRTPTVADRVAAVRLAGSETAMRISDRARSLGAAVPGQAAGRVAAGVLVVAVAGAVAYALLDTPTAPQEAPDPVVAEAVAPVPPPVEPVAPVPAAPVPQAVAAPLPVPPPHAVVADVVPEAALPDVTAGHEAAREAAPEPEYASTPVVAETVPDVTSTPDITEAHVVTPLRTADPAAPEQVSTLTGVPHLSGAGPAAGPPAQATPVATATTAPAPPAPPGPLGALFRALP